MKKKMPAEKNSMYGKESNNTETKPKPWKLIDLTKIWIGKAYENRDLTKQNSEIQEFFFVQEYIVKSVFLNFNRV
jgi:hypothetical protein